jgi:hypothetical protein
VWGASGAGKLQKFPILRQHRYIGKSNILMPFEEVPFVVGLS